MGCPCWLQAPAKLQMPWMARCPGQRASMWVEVGVEVSRPCGLQSQFNEVPETTERAVNVSGDTAAGRRLSTE